MTVRYGEGNLWSLGRVQTPVLAMIAERDDEIRHFKSEPFWELMTKYRDTPFKYADKRFPDKAKAEALLETLLDAPLHIDKIKQKTERQRPPQLFDLTELQREMNRRYGASAAETLKEAQALYENKFITYPRTDSQYITASMKKDVPSVLEALRDRKPTETARLDLTALDYTKSLVNDAKVTDHHAILPTGRKPGVLPSLQEKIFDAIHTRLLAAFYSACVKEATVVDASVVRGSAEPVPFTAKGHVIVEAGWTQLYPKPKDEADKNPLLPKFTEKESGPHAPYLREGKTQPPKHFTENSLLGAMATAGRQVDDAELRDALKDKGLGTPATRASIIETLLARKYLVGEKKKLVATERGRYLIALIQTPALKSPTMTGEWESKLKAIEQGKMTSESFMQEIAEFTRQVVCSGNAEQVDATQLGRCPCCTQPVIEGRRGYGCSAWKTGCTFVLWKEQAGYMLQPLHARKLLQNGILMGSRGKQVMVLSKQGALSTLQVPEAPPKKSYKRRRATG